MESPINFRSEISPFLTSPLIWGGYGIECQHSTFQWMMQGKTETSCDFIGVNDQDKNHGFPKNAFISSSCYVFWKRR